VITACIPGGTLSLFGIIIAVLPACSLANQFCEASNSSAVFLSPCLCPDCDGMTLTWAKAGGEEKRPKILENLTGLARLDEVSTRPVEPTVFARTTKPGFLPTVPTEQAVMSHHQPGCHSSSRLSPVMITLHFKSQCPIIPSYRVLRTKENRVDVLEAVPRGRIGTS
jgi:hypothetical protein